LTEEKKKKRGTKLTRMESSRNVLTAKGKKRKKGKR